MPLETNKGILKKLFSAQKKILLLETPLLTILSEFN
jgi:hypothetical protein